MGTIDLKIQARAVMFGDMAKGGYFRAYKATDYPGIDISIKAETRQAKPEITIFYDGQEYETTSAAVAAWLKNHPKKEGNDNVSPD